MRFHVVPRVAGLTLPTGLGLALLAVPVSAHAWGITGHRVTGEIAWRLLSLEARHRVQALFTPDRYHDLAETTTWCDTFARKHAQFDWLKPYHYIDVDPNADTIDMARDCPPEGCVIRGITENYANFFHDASLTFHTGALRRFSHFVGDVHQPLHVSHPDMMGGQKTHVVFLGKKTNLHDVWDDAIIHYRLTTIAQTAIPDSLWRDYVDVLVEHLDPDSVAAWKRAAVEEGEEAPIHWAQESLELSKAYCFEVQDGDTLGMDYVERVMPVIDKRLQQAGVRLAALIEAAVDNWTH